MGARNLAIYGAFLLETLYFISSLLKLNLTGILRLSPLNDKQKQERVIQVSYLCSHSKY